MIESITSVGNSFALLKKTHKKQQQKRVWTQLCTNQPFILYQGIDIIEVEEVFGCYRVFVFPFWISGNLLHDTILSFITILTFDTMTFR